MDLKKILNRQMLPFIKMIENILNNLDDDFLLKIIGKYQCWKMIYHPLYWMDYHLSGKEKLCPLQFHTDDLHKLDLISENSLTKKELLDYCKSVEKKIYDYREYEFGSR
jgi:hypothetical protein